MKAISWQSWVCTQHLFQQEASAFKHWPIQERRQLWHSMSSPLQPSVLFLTAALCADSLTPPLRGQLLSLDKRRNEKKLRNMLIFRQSVGPGQGAAALLQGRYSLGDALIKVQPLLCCATRKSETIPACSFSRFALGQPCFEPEHLCGQAGVANWL